MLVGFKTELNPNNKQATSFAKHCGVACNAWNIGLNAVKAILDHNKENPTNRLKLPTTIELYKWLVSFVKPDFPWYYEVSKCPPQQALRNLRSAFKDFFRGKRIRGKKVGFPKFKKKGKHDSFYLDGSIQCDHFAIKLPRIGWVRTYEKLSHGFKPKSVTISRKANRWFRSFKVEVPETDTVKTRNVIGVDLGIKTLATCSDGTQFSGIKPYKTLEKKLARRQYLLRKKVKHSNNYKKAQLEIARLHFRVSNLRRDNINKITTFLAKNHRVVVIEDLNVAGMRANHKLAKAIGDMGFYEFRRQLEYKCKLYGSFLEFVERFFPSSKTCSNCDSVKEKLDLRERIFKCDHCGLEIDRDLNASITMEKSYLKSNLI